MNKLTIKIIDIIYNVNELTDYLKSLSGVNNVTIDVDEEKIHIEYDSNITSIYILKEEIYLFSHSTTPYIVAFDKYSNKELINYTIIIKDLCCEYCLRNKIEELLLKDGIESCYTDFDNYNKVDVKLFITYNPDILTKENIIDIEEKLNKE